jgi:Caspase domain
MQSLFQKNFICLLWSMCFWGMVCAQSLLPATQLNASENLTEYILLTCHHSNNLATRLVRIYRSESPDFSKATIVVKAQHNLKFFDRDTNLKPNVWYYYWILEVNPATDKESKPSKMTNGKKVQQLEGTLRADIQLSPPRDVKAIDALNSIQLRWTCSGVYVEGELNNISGCDSIVVTKSQTIQTSFLIHRGESADVNEATPIAEVSGNAFTDDDPELKPNITYYYWIQATDSQGDVSAFSQSAKGQIRGKDSKFGMPATGQPTIGRKKALIMGASFGKTTFNGARSMATLLRDNGWSVTMGADWQTKNDFEVILQRFILNSALKAEDTLLIYYAGHGMSYKHNYYLVPEKATIRGGSDIPKQAFVLDSLLKPLMNKCQVQIVLLNTAYSDKWIRDTDTRFQFDKQYPQRFYKQNVNKWLFAHLLTDVRPLKGQTNDSFIDALLDILRRNPCMNLEDALREINVFYLSNGVNVSVKNCD